MEFKECFSLLTARPPHTHEHCEEEGTDKEESLKLNDVASQSKSDSEQAQDLTLLSPRQLIRTVYQLQEMRVLVYNDFRECVP